MTLTKLIGFASVSLGLTACASLLGGNDVKVRPLENMSSLTAISHDPLYESAVTAINTRDYARALEYLQEARTSDPRDVKALNALGVVYDKLGRFDLSARYYAQARAIDPESQIVTRNMDYSNSLQGLIGSGQVAVNIPAPVSSDTAATKKPASLASVYQPAALPAVPRENEAAVPMRNSPSVGAQPERKSVTAGADTVLATNERRHEYESMAGEATMQAVNASPLPKPIFREESLRKAVAEINTVARNDAMPENMLSRESWPLVANKVALVTDASLVVKSTAKEAPASKPVAKSQTVIAANESAPVASTWMIAKPEPKQRSASNPVLQARVITAKEAVPATSILPANKATSDSKVVPELKIAAANNMAPSGAPESKRGEVSMPAPRPLPAIKPVPASAVLPANKLPKARIMAADEAVSVQRNVPLSRPEPAKVVGPVKKIVLAIGPSNADTLRESQRASSVKVAKPVRKVLTIGQPVRIFNSSGRAIDVVPSRLTALGWSVRQVEGRIQESTTLYYLLKDTAAAKAMQRTLPFPVRLVSNPGAGMRLVVGRDYLSWKPKNGRLAALWKGTVVASLQRSPARGDR